MLRSLLSLCCFTFPVIAFAFLIDPESSRSMIEKGRHFHMVLQAKSDGDSCWLNAFNAVANSCKEIDLEHDKQAKAAVGLTNW